ncbi:LPS-assembly protein LptD [Brevundimonas terrae]|uniref:LPS-assembly protein LptD n=1 Tax=Brevundimonas terrae TaxID=363631 RepID=A0ABP3IB75_9CAUL|nr:LPS assembly protein LptD [Brevundimonas terrae]NIJ27104.1 LPS-assembly protein [Brevundimonas terrae]
MRVRCAAPELEDRMRDRHHPKTGALRLKLMAGAALCALPVLGVAGASVAQTAGVQPSPAPAAPVVQVRGEDGLTPDALYVEATSAEREGDTVNAKGGQAEDRVFARFQDHTLRAEDMTYDLKTGIAEAAGQVELISPDGTVVHASQLQLTEGLKTGIAVDLATRSPEGATLMAATAVRRSENISELNRVLFMPCPVCENDPKAQPAVTFQAEKAVQDEELRAILYRNVVVRVGGVPVFYTPYLAHPDPSVDRASGFLIPRIDYEQGLGLSIEAPYLHVVSPSEDWLFSPRVNTNVAPLMNVQWRRRFDSGTIVARGGYTYARNFGDFDLDGDGDAESKVHFGDSTHRSYILAHGKFDLNDDWRWGFTAERVSDKTLFDRYDVNSAYQDNGLYYGDRRRLISQIYAERQTQRSYLSVAAFSIQSLRLDPRFAATDFRDPDGFKVFESDNSLPLVAPIIDARWEPEGPVLGGRLRLQGSAVALTRDAYVGFPTLRPELVQPGPTDGLPGVDSRRVTGKMDWRRVMISPMGLRWEPFVDMRADVYSIDDLPPFLGIDNDTVSRVRTSAGVDVSYPLYRPFAGSGSIILEPMAQLSISNKADLDRLIPIEDSQTFELDHISLFRMDRFPGYDLLEGGWRFTAGARATFNWDDARSASLFVGRSTRADDEPAYFIPVPDDTTQLYDPSGLARRNSDWVVQGTFDPSERMRGWFHAVMDDSGTLRRAEATISGDWGRRNSGALSYILDNSNPLAGPNNRNYEFVQVAAQQFVYGNWGVTVRGIADMERDLITRSEVGLLYDDDCFRVEIGWRRDNTRVRPTGPSEGIFIRLNLATFGGNGYDDSELR